MMFNKNSVDIISVCLQRFIAVCALFVLVLTQPVSAQWTDAPIEYSETVSMVIDETPVWNWMPEAEHTRHFRDLAVSPNGEKIAFTVQLDWQQIRHIYIMNSDGTGVIDITGTLPADVLEQNAKDVGRLRWNDDGSRLFFFGIYYRDLYYYDVASGTTNIAVSGIADPDFRIPYSVNGAGTEITFKHNAGWNEALERTISGLFRAPVGGDPVNLVDVASLPNKHLSINFFRYLGAARTGNKAFFIWNQDYYGGNSIAQWMYDGVTTMQGELSNSVWPEQDLENSIVSADGSRAMYENKYRYPESPIMIGYVDTATGSITSITETFDLNGFAHQNLSYDGTKARLSSGINYHTVYNLDDMSMRDTASYYFKMNIYDITDMTMDNRYYYILTSKNNDTTTHRISKVDMAPVTFESAPQIHSVSFSAPVLFHGNDSRIKVKSHISDMQGLDNIEWVVLVPLVEGREYPDWPMGRVPLAFPTGDPGSVVLRDDGTAGDITAGDGIFSYNQVATRKGDYDGFNTWYTHYELPAEVGIRVIVKDIDDNYGIADTNLMITNDAPAAPAAEFVYSTAQEDSLMFNYTDISVGNIHDWSWVFGDGRIGSGPTVSHTYAERGIYDVTLTVTGPGGTDTYTYENIMQEGDVSVGEDAPFSFALDNPYPNPFNPTTAIGFTLPERLPVTLEVYDIRGVRISTLTDEAMDAGHHTLTWNGRHDDGTPASSGIYIFRLNAGTMTASSRAMMVK